MISAVEPTTLRAWLVGRSLARGLPPPVAVRGGWRVDTGTVAEIARWVFAAPGEGIAALGREIDRPGYALRLCGEAAALRALLSGRWRVEETGWFMIGGGASRRCPLPAGYSIATEHRGAVTTVRIVTNAGVAAASGHAARTAAVFVYDRIVVEPDHRRRGLGRALMAALGAARGDDRAPELLVATPAGRALYETLGWRLVSPYASATVPDGEGGLP